MSALFTYVGGPSTSGASRGFSQIMRQAGKDFVKSEFSAFAQWVSGTLVSGVISRMIEW